MKDVMGKAAAMLDVAELTHHKELLIERLATETGRYERIAYEDKIVAVEALIAGLVARLANHAATSKAMRDDS